jgi:hypothetical protein
MRFSLGGGGRVARRPVMVYISRSGAGSSMSTQASFPGILRHEAVDVLPMG